MRAPYRRDTSVDRDSTASRSDVGAVMRPVPGAASTIESLTRDGFWDGSVVVVPMGPVWMVSDEASLMRCYQAAVAEVFRYASMLCGSDRARAEDLVQDVFVALVRRVRAGEQIEASVGYLVVAVRHRFLDDVKHRAREQRRLELVAAAPPPEPAGSIGELAGLSERERTAMVLRFVDDLPVARVGEAMGISTRAAESLLARAARTLRAGGARHA